MKTPMTTKQEKQTYLSLQEFLSALQENCLLLARHGETDWNSMNVIQGQQDRPLNLTGYKQRRNLFFLLHSVPIARIYTSALQRSIQTAAPISEEKNVPLEIMPDLNEAKLGVLEGENKANFSDEFSEKVYQSFLKDEINTKVPGGGENLRMVDMRVSALVEKFLDSIESSGHTLIAGHRNVNKMIVKNLLGLSIEEGYRVEHEQQCLYIYAPKRKEIFCTKITAPCQNSEVVPGYVEID